VRHRVPPSGSSHQVVVLHKETPKHRVAAATTDDLLVDRPHLARTALALPPQAPHRHLSTRQPDHLLPQPAVRFTAVGLHSTEPHHHGPCASVSLRPPRAPKSAPLDTALLLGIFPHWLLPLARRICQHCHHPVAMLCPSPVPLVGCQPWRSHPNLLGRT
jgi:hypothetical protein